MFVCWKKLNAVLVPFDFLKSNCSFIIYSCLLLLRLLQRFKKKRFDWAGHESQVQVFPRRSEHGVSVWWKYLRLWYLGRNSRALLTMEKLLIRAPLPLPARLCAWPRRQLLRFLRTTTAVGRFVLSKCRTCCTSLWLPTRRRNSAEGLSSSDCSGKNTRNCFWLFFSCQKINQKIRSWT